MKRVVVERNGLIRPKESFTSYCIRSAAKGFVNGWYYPLLYQEHMDDPRTPHTGIKTDEDFQKLVPLSANTFKIKTIDQWIERMKISSTKLQEYSYDPSDFVGLRAYIKKILRLIGQDYYPKAK